MKTVIPLATTALLLAGCVGGAPAAAARPYPGKYLIVLQAGTEGHEGLARAVHALLYAQELKEKGHEVTLLFDGAGTEWALALTDPGNKLHPRFERLKSLGVVEVVCDFCSGAFDVKDRLPKTAPLVSEFEGHPSIAKWIAMGYVLIVL